jgi:DNA polymerase-3 subunit delta'
MFFHQIPGLPEIKVQLISGVRQGHVAHAQLLAGRAGSAALPLALAYSAYLNCEQPTAEDSCGTCPSCSKIHKQIHPDVHYVFPVTTTKDVTKDVLSAKLMAEWRGFLKEESYGSLNDWMQHIGAENKQGTISKEESRQLIRTLSLKAFEAKYKLILIWLPELMHPAAANALLKILEEPPAQTIFLFVSHDSDRLMPTIQSRLQRTQVRQFTDEELTDYLVSREHLTPEQAQQVALLAEGNLQAARQLSSEATHDYFGFFRDWMRACHSFKVEKILSLSDEFQKLGRENQKNLFQYSTGMLRKVILYGVAPELSAVAAGEQEFVQKFSPSLRPDNRELLSDELCSAQYHIERNANPKIVFTDTSLTIAQLLRKN